MVRICCHCTPYCRPSYFKSKRKKLLHNFKRCLPLKTGFELHSRQGSQGAAAADSESYSTGRQAATAVTVVHPLHVTACQSPKANAFALQRKIQKSTSTMTFWARSRSGRHRLPAHFLTMSRRSNMRWSCLSTDLHSQDCGPEQKLLWQNSAHWQAAGPGVVTVRSCRPAGHRRSWPGPSSALPDPGMGTRSCINNRNLNLCLARTWTCSPEPTQWSTICTCNDIPSKCSTSSKSRRCTAQSHKNLQRKEPAI